MPLAARRGPGLRKDARTAASPAPRTAASTSAAWQLACVARASAMTPAAPSNGFRTAFLTSGDDCKVRALRLGMQCPALVPRWRMMSWWGRAPRSAPRFLTLTVPVLASRAEVRIRHGTWTHAGNVPCLRCSAGGRPAQCRATTVGGVYGPLRRLTLLRPLPGPLSPACRAFAVRDGRPAPGLAAPPTLPQGRFVRGQPPHCLAAPRPPRRPLQR